MPRFPISLIAIVSATLLKEFRRHTSFLLFKETVLILFIGWELKGGKSAED
jgi:hypothetical protein